MAELFGRTKERYAERWGYRNLVYQWPTWDDFFEWCNATQLGGRVGTTGPSHPSVKFFTMAHAMNEMDCRYVMWTDADSVIVNPNMRLTFDWPGTVKSGGRPQMLFGLAAFPQGKTAAGELGSVVVPEGEGLEFCGLDACHNFSKMLACYNSGVLVMRRSAAMLTLIQNIMANDLPLETSNMTGCSTADSNVWKVDQCAARPNDRLGDQCLTGCTMASQMAQNGEAADAPPAGISCLPAGTETPLQAVWKVSWADPHHAADAPQLPPSAFVVNLIGASKGKAIMALADNFSVVADWVDGMNETERMWLEAIKER